MFLAKIFVTNAKMTLEHFLTLARTEGMQPPMSFSGMAAERLGGSR